MRVFSTYASPAGKLLLARDESGLRLLWFLDGVRPLAPKPDWCEDGTAFDDVFAQLDEYFAGRRQRFDVPLAPEGTPFQQRVWRALQEIPYGATMTYGALSRQLGDPQAVRAVAAANGRNPISILIPCHRVIGHNGRLTGYGGGLPAKQALLALEARNTGGSQLALV